MAPQEPSELHGCSVPTAAGRTCPIGPVDTRPQKWQRLAIRRAAVIATLFVALVAAVPAAQADFVTKQYFNGTLGGHGNPSSGTAYWKTNKVWRPVGYRFAVWFSNSSTIQAGFQESSVQNPVVTRGSFGYDWGSCLNEENFGVSTVTCQIYNWNA